MWNCTMKFICDIEDTLLCYGVASLCIIYILFVACSCQIVISITHVIIIFMLFIHHCSFYFTPGSPQQVQVFSSCCYMFYPQVRRNATGLSFLLCLFIYWYNKYVKLVTLSVILLYKHTMFIVQTVMFYTINPIQKAKGLKEILQFLNTWCGKWWIWCISTR